MCSKLLYSQLHSFTQHLFIEIGLRCWNVDSMLKTGYYGLYYVICLIMIPIKKCKRVTSSHIILGEFSAQMLENNSL